jgi:predicted metal-binding protein
MTAGTLTPDPSLGNSPALQAQVPEYMFRLLPPADQARVALSMANSYALIAEGNAKRAGEPPELSLRHKRSNLGPASTT